MMPARFLLLALFVPALALAGPSLVPPQEHPVLREIAGTVSAEQLQAIDTKLVSFGTRHTLSETQSDTRGIGAARRWVKTQFEGISRDCGGCLEVITPAQVMTGRDLPPQGVEIMDVVAIQKGSDPNRYLVMTAHLDSRVSNIMNAAADAPGADDDGSGVAAVLEMARVMSRHEFDATIVFMAVAGEEEGLYGSTHWAEEAKARSLDIAGMLDNDIIGSSHDEHGGSHRHVVRLFAEGVPAVRE
ncbi:MAG: M20/M25/M40 family metallo-hydrolase, partial [Gammaproteobacteria bacterium]